MSAACQRIRGAVAVIAFCLTCCQTAPPGREVPEDRPPSARESEGEAGGERGPREVAIRAEVTFGVAFFAAPPPDIREGHLGPLTILLPVDESDPLRTRVSVRNEGPDPVSGVVLTDRVRVTAETTSEAAAGSGTVPNEGPAGMDIQISGVPDTGTCTHDASSSAATFTCELGTLDPGQTATLTVTVTGPGTRAEGQIAHDVRVAALLP